MTCVKSSAAHLSLVCECLQDWFRVAQHWDSIEIAAFKLRKEMRETDGPRGSPFARRGRGRLLRDKVYEGTPDD